MVKAKIFKAPREGLFGNFAAPVDNVVSEALAFVN